ncbi:MAG: hypothetical protein ABR574_04920 [Cryomorphaceae bacterium]
MRISFGTKEEHKFEKQEAFLALSPADRFYAFLRLSRRIAEFPTARKKDESSSNLIIKPKTKN